MRMRAPTLWDRLTLQARQVPSPLAARSELQAQALRPMLNARLGIGL
jgi:hypothetical protein